VETGRPPSTKLRTDVFKAAQRFCSADGLRLSVGAPSKASAFVASIWATPSCKREAKWTMPNALRAGRRKRFWEARQLQITRIILRISAAPFGAFSCGRASAESPASLESPQLAPASFLSRPSPERIRPDNGYQNKRAEYDTHDDEQAPIWQRHGVSFRGRSLRERQYRSLEKLGRLGNYSIFGKPIPRGTNQS
jgi:hypothetical protein